MRGAYEVGIVAGIMEALDREPGFDPVFQVFAGTSVGAINATYLASNASYADHAVERLAEVWKSLRLEGFLVREHGNLQGELEAFLIPHIQAGRVGLDETIVEGFERIVDAFLGVLTGKNVGKMIVRVAHE